MLNHFSTRTVYFMREPDSASGRSAAPGQDAMPDRDFPIRNYANLSTEEIESRLDGLSNEDMAKVLTYECRTRNRQRLIEEINWRLGSA